MVHGGSSWTVRLGGRATPAKVRWHLVVAREAPGNPKLPDELKRWRERGFHPRTFEIGTVFGIKGQVLDSRHVLVTVDPRDDEAAAREAARALGARFHVEAGVHPELVERARGVLVASDDHGTTIENDGILWFAPEEGGLLELRDVDKEAAGARAVAISASFTSPSRRTASWRW